MVLRAVPFAHIAESIGRRAADLFAASTMVVDEHDVVVARAEPGGGATGGETPRDWRPALRIPIRLPDRTGHLIVADHAERISPRLSRELVDLMVTQFAVVSRLPTREDLRGKLVRDLVTGSVTDEANMVREAQIFGMDLSRPRAAILVHAAEYILAPASPSGHRDETVNCERARALIDQVVQFFNLPNAAICSYLGDGEVVILKASSTRDLAPWSDNGGDGQSPLASWANLAAQKRAGRELLAWLERQTRTSVTIGIGRYHAGLVGLARSYGDARTALSLGRRLGIAKQPYCLDDLGAAAFVGISDDQTKSDLAFRLLGPLDPEPDLLGTLRAFFDENRCPSQTSKRLAIHRNTLGYRLDKITSLTGLDPRRFDDAVQIRLALLLRTVGSDAAAPPLPPHEAGAPSR